jgi:hypothetical protein
MQKHYMVPVPASSMDAEKGTPGQPPNPHYKEEGQRVEFHVASKRSFSPTTSNLPESDRTTPIPTTQAENEVRWRALLAFPKTTLPMYALGIEVGRSRCTPNDAKVPLVYPRIDLVGLGNHSTVD